MKAEDALNSPAFPCNPVPFANRLVELCTGDCGAIQSDRAKACLMILVQQAYGQMAVVDTVNESLRIMPILRGEGAST